MVPFFHGEKIAGCIVEFTDIDFPDQMALDSFPNSDLDKIAAFLVNSRKRIGRIGQNSILDANQIMEATNHTIKQAQKEEKHLIFLIVDLSSILDLLMKDIVYLDRFYLKKDLQATLSLLSTDSGFCGTANGDKTIIALKTKKPHSKNVIIHQINQLLQVQCFEGREIPEFNILSRIWPEDGLTADELLSDFINGDE